MPFEIKKLIKQLEKTSKKKGSKKKTKMAIDIIKQEVQKQLGDIDESKNI